MSRKLLFYRDEYAKIKEIPEERGIPMDLVEKEELNEELKKIVSIRKLKRRLFTIVLVCVMALLVFVFAWFGGRNHASGFAEDEINRLKTEISNREKEIQNLLDTPIIAAPVAPQINLDTIYSEIVDIGELATVEYLFTDAAKYSDSMQYNDWNIPFTEKSFVLKWNGVIKAGMILEDVDITVDEEAGKITVSMPPAQILSYIVDRDSIEVLDERDSIFNSITIDDKMKFDATTEEAMRQRAIDNGLLDKAQKNAQDIIRRLLTANPAVGDAYVIEFQVSDK
jgi:hypothetical protein